MKFPWVTLKIGNRLYDHARKFSSHVTNPKGSKVPCEFYACVNLSTYACEFTCKLRSVHTRMVTDPIYVTTKNWELAEISHKHTCKPIKNLDDEVAENIKSEKMSVIEPCSGPSLSVVPREPSKHDLKSIRVQIARRSTKRSTFPALTLKIDGEIYDHVRSHLAGKLISKGGFESLISSYHCTSLKKRHIQCRFTCKIRSVFSNDNSEQKFWSYKNWKCIEIFNTHTCRPGMDFEKKMNLSVSEYNSEDDSSEYEFVPDPEESQEISLETLSKFYNEKSDPSEPGCSKNSSKPTEGGGPIIVSMRRANKNSRCPVIRLKIGNDEFDCKQYTGNRERKQGRFVDKQNSIYPFYCDAQRKWGTTGVRLTGRPITCGFKAEFKTLFSNDYSGPRFWEQENWALVRIRTEHTCEPASTLASTVANQRVKITPSYRGPFPALLPEDFWAKADSSDP